MCSVRKVRARNKNCPNQIPLANLNLNEKGKASYVLKEEWGTPALHQHRSRKIRSSKQLERCCPQPSKTNKCQGTEETGKATLPPRSKEERYKVLLNQLLECSGRARARQKPIKAPFPTRAFDTLCELQG